MRLTEDAAQLLYRKAHLEGAQDILNHVLKSLEEMEIHDRGTSFDTLWHAIRLVESYQRSLGDTLRCLAEVREKERAHRERMLSALPLRTEEEIRKDRLYAGEKIFTPPVDSGQPQA